MLTVCYPMEFFVKRIKGLANWPLVRDICMQISQQAGGKHSLEALEALQTGGPPVRPSMCPFRKGSGKATDRGVGLGCSPRS